MLTVLILYFLQGLILYSQLRIDPVRQPVNAMPNNITGNILNILEEKCVLCFSHTITLNM